MVLKLNLEKEKEKKSVFNFLPISGEGVVSVGLFRTIVSNRLFDIILLLDNTVFAIYQNKEQT